jgi:type I restriction enzyme M protein
MSVEGDAHLSDGGIEPEFADDGRLIDFLSRTLLVDLPEERVRQQYLRILHFQYGYAKDMLARQVPIQRGSSQARDETGSPIFADIVVYETAAAQRSRDQGSIRFVVEVKRPDEESGLNQLVSYIFNTSANGAVWYNGKQAKWYRRYQTPEQRMVAWPGIPRPGEAWDAVGRRSKDGLRALLDVRGTFERCHNKLFRRGSEGDDLTMDMVRILLAKARDEEREDSDPLFYCTPEEYGSEAGRQEVAARIEQLFEEIRDANPTVFDATEQIRVGNRQITEVVVELQDYRLLGDNDEQWDVMGAA